MPVFSDLWKEKKLLKKQLKNPNLLKKDVKDKFEAGDPEPKAQPKPENEKGSKINSMDVIVKPAKLVCMANLSVIAGHFVNGVTEFHS